MERATKDINREKYHLLGTKLLETQRSQLKTQLEVFQSALLEFQQQNQQEIGKSLEIQSSFAEICIAFGIDPLTITSDKNEEEKKNQLALKIMEYCTNSRYLNGGIVAIPDLVTSINKDVKVNAADLAPIFKELDIINAIDTLAVLGNELQLAKIGRKHYIKCTPQELNTDQQLIIETADMLGFVSISMLRDNFNWKRVRCKSGVEELVANGILWVDSQGEDNETKFWTTSWINKNL